MIDLERHGAVFVLKMKAGENRFHPPFIEALGEALDEVETSEGPAALVTTGEGKFYSEGDRWPEAGTDSFRAAGA